MSRTPNPPRFKPGESVGLYRILSVEGRRLSYPTSTRYEWFYKVECLECGTVKVTNQKVLLKHSHLKGIKCSHTEEARSRNARPDVSHQPLSPELQEAFAIAQHNALDEIWSPPRIDATRRLVI